MVVRGSRRRQDGVAGVPGEQGVELPVVRAAGVQSEMELAFAGCTSCWRRCWTGWTGCPVPQRDALRTVFGVSVGPAPEPAVRRVGRLEPAVEVAEDRALICVVGRRAVARSASAQVLDRSVARRLARNASRWYTRARSASSWRATNCEDLRRADRATARRRPADQPPLLGDLDTGSRRPTRRNTGPAADRR